MTKNRALISFTRKWLPKFRDSRTPYSELFETMCFAEDCFSLGFEMDCGKSFKEKLPECFDDPSKLESAIGKIDDVGLLGSGLHSNWRYFNHWNYFSGCTDDDLRWFEVVLMRLAEVAGDSFYEPPKGPVVSMYLDSNCIFSDPSHEPGKIFRQRIEIHSDGGARVAWFASGDGRSCSLSREKRLEVNGSSAETLLSKVKEWVIADRPDSFAIDIGCWTMTLEDAHGRSIVRKGSLVPVDQNLEGIMNELRDLLVEPDLFLFDDLHFAMN